MVRPKKYPSDEGDLVSTSMRFPEHLKRRFKAWCALQGIDMAEAFMEFMRDKTRGMETTAGPTIHPAKPKKR